MGIEITEKARETRVKQTSMLNTQKSLFGLNGCDRDKGKTIFSTAHSYVVTIYSQSP